MGYSDYSISSRSLRSKKLGYSTKSIDEIFTQSKENRIHESMTPKGVLIRECRDSETHKNTVPIILALDVTGSMGKIPHELVKNGLPTLMGNLIQKGADDASLLFLAIGDHECDRYPLQVGQFESGDAELDMWLTRTFLEGGGGGNSGESYFLAHYFAAKHTATDSFSKHGKKGFLFTVGDEPFLKTIPASAIKEIMGEDESVQGSLNYTDILSEVQKTYNVFHIHILHSRQAELSFQEWKDLLGQNCIGIADYTQVPNVITDVVISRINDNIQNSLVQSKDQDPEQLDVSSGPTNIIL